MSEPPVEISIIAPAYNEQDCLTVLVDAIRAAMEKCSHPREILLVDDGSYDRTAAVIRELEQAYPEVRGLFHRAHFGQSASLATGFRHARGNIITTLNADLQNPPGEISRLIGLLAPGTDAVCGVRQTRNDTSIRRFSSRMANRYRDWMTGVPVRDAGCNLRIMRREALREIPIFNGTHRFLTTFLKLQGLKVVETEVAHEPRHAGHSKYGIGNRMWRGIEDCFAIRWYRRRCLPAKRSNAPETINISGMSNDRHSSQKRKTSD